MFDTAGENFAAGGVLLLFFVGYLVFQKVQSKLDQRKIRAYQESTANQYFGELSRSLDERRQALIADGLDLSKPLPVVHYVKAAAKHETTPVDIMKATFYEVGYDNFGQGADDRVLWFQHTTNLGSRGFDRRVAEIALILDEHGWHYDGFEVVGQEKKEMH